MGIFLPAEVKFRNSAASTTIKTRILLADDIVIVYAETFHSPTYLGSPVHLPCYCLLVAGDS